MKSKILMLSGFVGSGKDTSERILTNICSELGVSTERIPLSARMKEIFCRHYNLETKWVEELKLKEKILDKPLFLSREFYQELADGFEKDPKILSNLPELEVPSVRKALQYIGTEVLRDHYGKDIHCEYLDNKAQKSKSDIVVVTDLRFLSESEYFKNEIKFFVDRKSCVPEFNEDLHESEKQMFELMRQLPSIDNNSDLDNLSKEIREKIIKKHIFI